MTALELRGGLVLDPAAETFRPGIVHLAAGRVTDRPVPGARVVDVTGCHVTPGLVDLHTHVFGGQDLGVPADEVGPASGTTTVVDAGSAGGHLLDAFRRTSVDPATVRVRALVNIASIGATSIRLAGELTALPYCDVDVAVAAARRHADIVAGIKVRASADVGGDNAPVALERARRAADRAGLPLMVHLGPAPAGVEAILRVLRAGDILTHCFTGFAGNAVVRDGRVRDAVLAARQRGVLLDVGHGMSGFDATVAAAAIAQGVLPDTISSDLHAYSRPAVGTLPRVLAAFVALGLTPAQAFVRATAAPAAVLGRSAALRAGEPADVAVFRLAEEPVEHRDGHGHTFPGRLRVRPVLTVVGGDVVFSDGSVAVR